MLDKMIHFVTSCALGKYEPRIEAIRNTEYSIALHKLQVYNSPNHVVISECDEEMYGKSVFKNFSFTSKTLIPSTNDLFAKTKSQKEFVSIKQCLPNLEGIKDDDWIIKTTGRYVFVSDVFYTIVKNAEPKARAIIKLCTPAYQAYTFCFAMRAKEFREFYSQPLEDIGGKNVERFLVEFIQKKGIMTSTLSVANLGILANIANSGNYQRF